LWFEKRKERGVHEKIKPPMDSRGY